ncbi:histone H2A.Z-specific chaperone CHZ1-like [Papaver somniferum]|uniref:histone H2A.Z-specific chaperone CHZ1-like n=1 Tax=Papaver somniferum TaxID=3469 RepID=UPI000E6FC60F|nr:histone H2A.Z-specific chaperone CHZ1-like [Papaver somniferum]
MADPSGQNPPNADEELPVEQPKSPERDRKDEECAEKHAKAPNYGSAIESDSEASDGFEYDVEEVNTSDLDSDAAEDKRKMEAYHERRVRSRFEYELANPKIFARTMNEGEPRRVDVKMICAKSDEEDTEEEEDGEDGTEDSSSSSGTSPAPSDNDDSERYEEEGCDTGEEDFW